MRRSIEKGFALWVLAITASYCVTPVNFADYRKNPDGTKLGVLSYPTIEDGQ
jgi:hypothetical protein